jgi:Mor family transcriptional regulator
MKRLYKENMGTARIAVRFHVTRETVVELVKDVVQDKTIIAREKADREAKIKAENQAKRDALAKRNIAIREDREKNKMSIKELEVKYELSNQSLYRILRQN